MDWIIAKKALARRARGVSVSLALFIDVSLELAFSTSESWKAWQSTRNQQA